MVSVTCHPSDLVCRAGGGFWLLCSISPAGCLPCTWGPRVQAGDGQTDQTRQFYISLSAPPTSPPTTVGATGIVSSTDVTATAATTEATTVPTIPTVAPTTIATTTVATTTTTTAATTTTTTTTALLRCGATALSVIQGTAQPYPSSPTSAQRSLSSSPFLVHTPSKEEGKHRTERGARQSLLFSPLGPLAPPSSFSQHQLPYPKGSPQRLRRLTPLPCPKA